jgi:YidC/Oxa1 family membrane protein insertase
MLSTLYNDILINPMLNLLVIVYNSLPWADMGLAIIVVTILIRLLLFPLAQKSTRAQIALQKLQPEIEKIRDEHKDDKQVQTQKIMEFYQKNKVNPLGSCLPLLLQLPIIFALYQVFNTGLSIENLTTLYDFVPRPETLNTVFVGIIDLTERNIALAVIAGAFQFVQSRMLTAKNKKQQAVKPKTTGDMPDIGNMMSKQMTYFMPIITVFIGSTLPAALTLYWVVVTLFAIVQQYFLQKKFKQEKNG